MCAFWKTNHHELQKESKMMKTRSVECNPAYPIALLSMTIVLLSLSSCCEDNTGEASKEVLKVKVNKDVVTDLSISREISVHIEEGQIVVEPHLVAVHGGSDVRVTTRREGKSILVLEEEVKGDTLSSLGQAYRIDIWIDASDFPAGEYDIFVRRKLWNGSEGQWVTETVFEDTIVIDG